MSSKGLNAESNSPYSANKGEISSPNSDSIIDSLTEAHGGLAVNHNKHIGEFDKGASTISTPATDALKG